MSSPPSPLRWIARRKPISPWKWDLLTTNGADATNWTPSTAQSAYTTPSPQPPSNPEQDSLELEGAYLGDLASSRSDMRRNHAVLALFAMAQAAEREPDVALTITKRIPVGAGLGGGSADAAATMLAVNRLWELNWPIERLRTIAATLGADMPFCLTGGLAYGTGFGERITDIAPAAAMSWR